MSGGVDSSVAAFLLKKQGYDVTGVFMKNWSDPLSDECIWKEDMKDFHDVCKVLKIPSKIEIFEDEYRDKIVNYLIRGYKKGITPNPDMLCNREIKFKLFLDKAKNSGADFIATGHYVKKVEGIDNDRKPRLKIAKDKSKDQSYFLALLNDYQISNSLFPIGDYLKQEVRSIAKKQKIPVYNKKDSQGICFIGKVKFNDFIRKYISCVPGEVIDTNGKYVGQHDGLAFYTIGQRHGLKIGGGVPYYVSRKIKKSNTLIVARGDDDASLYSRIVYVKNLQLPGLKRIPSALRCKARIRYQQHLQDCLLKKRGNDYFAYFTKRQRAVTPGQFIVFYKRSFLLGGGEIYSAPLEKHL